MMCDYRSSLESPPPIFKQPREHLPCLVRSCQSRQRRRIPHRRNRFDHWSRTGLWESGQLRVPKRLRLTQHSVKSLLPDAAPSRLFFETSNGSRAYLSWPSTKSPGKTPSPAVQGAKSRTWQRRGWYGATGMAYCDEAKCRFRFPNLSSIRFRAIYSTTCSIRNRESRLGSRDFSPVLSR